MRKNVFILSLLTIATLSVLSFIYFSNDHIECENEISTTIDENGNTVKKEIHICKEKYNF